MATKKKTIIEKAKDIAEEIVEEAEEMVQDVENAADKVVKKATTKKAPTSKKSKLDLLKEKAKLLEAGVKESSTEDLASKVKQKDDVQEDKGDLLLPLEDYMKSSIHLGTRVITPDLKPFVYRRRADGLAIFNTSKIDEKIREVADYIAEFKPEQITVVGKREAAWPALETFAELTGVKVFTKKYPSGVLTNSNLDDFMETDLIIIVDPWLDKNALNDAKRIKVPVVAICDTNNYLQKVDKFLIGNNKSYKSLGMIFYLIAKLYREKTKADFPEPNIKDFVPDWDVLQPGQ
jgi:small subunit ribosomal protein S2